MIDNELLEKFFINKKQELTSILEPHPYAVPPVVTQSDVSSGYITRYFVRVVNDREYVVEVDKKQYQNLKNNPRFVTTTVKWKIIGKKETITLQTGINLYGVEDLNKISVANADLTFGGLRKYISSYLDYWVAEK